MKWKLVDNVWGRIYSVTFTNQSHPRKRIRKDWKLEAFGRNVEDTHCSNVKYVESFFLSSSIKKMQNQGRNMTLLIEDDFFFELNHLVYLLFSADGLESVRLSEIYARLEEIEADKAPAR